ncbi:MAG: hypothetical protein NXH95_20750 [Pseudomonadaceae bacterium]|nr:hypothetical protein [Pseudomonadaceae bacterium]
MAISEPAPAIAQVLASYPPQVTKRLQQVRRNILNTAHQLDIGEVIETLKWNEVSYLPAKSGVGSTLRIGYSDKMPKRYQVYVHCGTNLIDMCKTLFPELSYQGNRGIAFALDEPLPRDVLTMLTEMTLTYHRNKRKQVATG